MSKISLLPAATVLICSFESFTKGWFSLILIPSLVLVLPLYTLVSVFALRQSGGPHQLWIRRLQLLLSGALIIAYVCTIGFGDTEETLLFGFYSSTVSSPLGITSTVLAIIAFVLVPIIFGILVLLLIANRRGRTAHA